MLICSNCGDEFCGECDCQSSILMCFDCNLILCDQCLYNEEDVIKENCHYDYCYEIPRFYCKICYNFRQIKFVDEFQVYCKLPKDTLYLFKIDKSCYKLMVSYDQYRIAVKNTIEFLLYKKLNIYMINLIIKYQN